MLVGVTVSDPELGSVSLDGVFTALKPGNVTLTAECNGFTDRIEIEIFSSLRGILLNTHEKTLLYRQTDQLAYALIPEDTTDDLTIAWASNNPRIVTVGENGLASAVGPGTAIVTLDVNGFRDQCIYH